MFKLPCPSCGADLTFLSTASVYAICSYCKTAAVRHDMNLQTYGKVSDIRMDATPLQLQTRGRYQQRGFQLIGRARMGWENGFWNEWAALFDNGEYGWLAEAQGFYMMSFQSHYIEYVPSSRQLFPGTTVALYQTPSAEKQHYQVIDIKKATCIGCEGELPFVVPIGRKTLNIDLSTAEGLFATIEYTEDQTQIFYGEYVDFDVLKFSDLRELDGW
jgi:hypothetical protein